MFDEYEAAARAEAKHAARRVNFALDVKSTVDADAASSSSLSSTTAAASGSAGRKLRFKSASASSGQQERSSSSSQLQQQQQFSQPQTERDWFEDEFLKLMQERFIRGEDVEFFDYSTVDNDVRLDDLHIRNADEEEAYFDNDEGYAMPMQTEQQGAAAAAAAAGNDSHANDTDPDFVDYDEMSDFVLGTR